MQVKGQRSKAEGKGQRSRTKVEVDQGVPVDREAYTLDLAPLPFALGLCPLPFDLLPSRPVAVTTYGECRHA